MTTQPSSGPLMGTVKYREGKDFRKVLNRSLAIFWKDALRVSLKDPGQAYFMLQTVRRQQKAARRRNRLAAEGVHVPPILIFSVTNRCNLNCLGCYHRAAERSSAPEMSREKVREVFAEARELGITFIVMAGGEPLARPEIIDLTAEFPDIIFLVFTNGTLLDDALVRRLKQQRNFIPAISLEGWEEETDARRGEGVYERLSGIIEKLKKADIFWSVSLTVTRSNFRSVTDKAFIDFLLGLGCKLFFFAEYTPVNELTDAWVITPEQRAELTRLRDEYRRTCPALFVTVPGDEEEIGGCLSAGRGFVHVSAQGDVEPCPFVPLSDISLRNTSLKEALKSDFLRTIRDNHESFHETRGGCTLWLERDWVRSLLEK